MKEFLVIGLGRFGASVAKTLAENGYDVLGIDRDEDVVQELADILTQAVQADAMDEEVLSSLGVSEFDVAVVCIGSNIEASIFVTLILKKLGIKYVIAKAKEDNHGRVLEKVGADRIVFPEREMGSRVAHNLMSSNVLDYIELATDYSIVEIRTTENMVGESIIDLDLRRKFGVSVIGIKRDDKVNFVPGPRDTIEENDTLLVIGTNDQIETLKNY
ncbi:MAG: TrkA family potassium uptake protein [Verrucomicrobiota bacterium]|nr:TrkA family potassium uptake protein [Verrucomicrobiota bacterium]